MSGCILPKLKASQTMRQRKPGQTLINIFPMLTRVNSKHRSIMHLQMSAWSWVVERVSWWCFGRLDCFSSWHHCTSWAAGRAGVDWQSQRRHQGAVNSWAGETPGPPRLRLIPQKVRDLRRLKDNRKLDWQHHFSCNQSSGTGVNIRHRRLSKRTQKWLHHQQRALQSGRQHCFEVQPVSCPGQHGADHFKTHWF